MHHSARPRETTCARPLLVHELPARTDPLTHRIAEIINRPTSRTGDSCHRVRAAEALAIPSMTIAYLPGSPLYGPCAR